MSVPFFGHSAPVNSVVLSSDGSCVASASTENTVPVWNVSALTGPTECENELIAAFLSVEYSLDDSRIVLGDVGGVIRVHDIKGKISRVLKGHTARFTSVVFSSDGAYIVSGLEFGMARVCITSR